LVYSSSLLFHLLEIDLLGPISLGRCFGGTAIRPYPGWVDGMHGSDGMDSPYIHTARNPRTMGWSFTTLSLDQQRISSICASIKIESLVSENNIWTFMIRIHQSPLPLVNLPPSLGRCTPFYHLETPTSVRVRKHARLIMRGKFTNRSRRVVAGKVIPYFFLTFLPLTELAVNSLTKVGVE